MAEVDAEVDANADSMMTDPFMGARPTMGAGRRSTGFAETELQMSHLTAMNKDSASAGRGMIITALIVCSSIGFISIGLLLMCVSCCVKGVAKGVLLFGGVVIVFVGVICSGFYWKYLK